MNYDIKPDAILLKARRTIYSGCFKQRYMASIESEKKWWIINMAWIWLKTSRYSGD